MSDSYDRGGVNIAPGAGGYYDLTHPSLPDGTERVQGRERAESRADEIAQAAAAAGGSQGGEDDGRMEGQMDSSLGNAGDTPKAPKVTTDGTVDGDGDDRSAAEKRQETDAVSQGKMDNRSPGTVASSDPAARASSDEIVELRRQLAAAHDKIGQLTDAAQTVTTVTTTDEPAPAVPTMGSRHFVGEMSKGDRSALKKAGIETRTIVLEENDNIPPTGLFIGHNGKSYVIKPGEEVEVPKFLTDVLDDAVMAAPIVDSATQKILGYRNRSRYPYRLVKG